MKRFSITTALVIALSAAGVQGGGVVTRISGASPFAGKFCGPAAVYTPGHVYEPTVAVNPTNPSNLVAAWIQDGGVSVVSASSFDGGQTWQTHIVPGISYCAGGNSLGAVDPRVVIGPDGIVYLSTVGPFPDPRAYVYVNHSTDGGSTWSDPVWISLTSAPNDFPTIVAEPDRPKTADLMWSGRGVDGTWFARTTDGGASWSIPRLVRATTPGKIAGGMLTALGGGTLVYVFSEGPLVAAAFGLAQPSDQIRYQAINSKDSGATWSAPVPIITVPFSAGSVIEAASGPGGSVTAIFNDVQSDGSVASFVITSSDDGATWGARRLIGPVAGAKLLPALVDQAGGINVLFDDHRSDTTPGDSSQTTDVWSTRSQDGGATWTETHVWGPFESTNFLGDYQELKPTPTGLYGVFAADVTTDGPTAIFGARID